MRILWVRLQVGRARRALHVPVRELPDGRLGQHAVSMEISSSVSHVTLFKTIWVLGSAMDCAR
jgi:hypothetical protein